MNYGLHILETKLCNECQLVIVCRQTRQNFTKAVLCRCLQIRQGAFHEGFTKIFVFGV